MSGPKTRANPLLIFIAVILCLVCGVILNRSSVLPSPIDDEHMPDILLVDNTDSLLEDDSDKTAHSEHELTVTPEVQEPEATPTPEPTKIPEKTEPEVDYVPSPEAYEGVWTPSGSNWLFLINGSAYKGWLYDTDEKVYYLNDSGIMETGWKNIGDKRYYFNLDGIMQTGDVVYKGKTYHFLKDGSLEGYSVAAEKAKKKAEKEKAKAQENESAKIDESNEDDLVKNDTSAPNAESKEVTKQAADKTVALTFDDGPSSFTGRLLDCLSENDAKATFFLVGYEIENFPEEVKRMQELGMDIGNHTADHADLTTLNAEEITYQIEHVNEQLQTLIGQGATVLRPPYGAINDTVKETASLPMILWSIDTLDWDSKDPEKIVESVLTEVKDGSIILMHDIYSTTVDAVEILIPELISQGYKFVTVHELAETFGVTLENGNSYRTMN